MVIGGNANSLIGKLPDNSLSGAKAVKGRFNAAKYPRAFHTPGWSLFY